MVVLDPGHLALWRQLPIKVVLQRERAPCENRFWSIGAELYTMFNALPHLVGQIQHTQVCLYFQAEGREAGHTVLWPRELMEDDGVFGVQLLLFPTQMEAITLVNM